MKIRDWIINKLEKIVEPDAGHIDLDSVDESKRKQLFKQFGEGDENLTKFLETAYNNGAPSLFCCSGHGIEGAYAVLKVTDDNIELLQKLGKVLSKYGISTNFTDDHIRGVIVNYTDIKGCDTNWLKIASKVMDNPELFDDSNPEIWYHSEIYKSFKPFGFDLKKKLLHYLRKDAKQLQERTEYNKFT